MSTTNVRGRIDEFLATKRLAVVGVAHNPQEFGHKLYQDLRNFGYEALPVNPGASEIDGERCYSRLQDIQPGVQAALLLTPPAANEQVVRDCAEAGIRLVWFYGAGDRSKENEQAIAYCQQHGISVIPGFCPYMFIPQSPFFHKIHGFVARVTGSGPR